MVRFSSCVFVTALIAAVSLFAFGGTARATVIFDCDGEVGEDAVSSCTLEDLVRNDGSIVVGDKRFDGWSFPGGGFDIESTAGFNALPSEVAVSGLDDGGDFGLFFAATGQTWEVSDQNGSGETQRSGFFYVVTVLDPGFLIHDNELKLTARAVATLGEDELAQALVGEIPSLVPLGFPQGMIGTKQVGIIDEGGGDFTFDQDVDSLLFAPVSSLLIFTEVFVLAQSNSGGRAEINSFEQRFSQVAVPEPTAIGLIGLGLGALGLMRRRRRSSKG